MRYPLHHSPLLFFLLLALFCTTAKGEWLSGTVTKVIDGDSLQVQLLMGEIIEVRLAYIDAPEWNQAGGRAARSNLASWLPGQQVKLSIITTDRYQREVAVVKTNIAACQACPPETDIGWLQISAGHAWWYSQYAPTQSSDEQRLYQAAQQQAKDEGAGLWHSPKPVPPWQWRREGAAAK